MFQFTILYHICKFAIKMSLVCLRLSYSKLKCHHSSPTVKQSSEIVQTYSKCVELIADRTFCCSLTCYSTNRHSLASTALNLTQIQPEMPQIVSNSINCCETHPDRIWDVIVCLISFQTCLNCLNRLILFTNGSQMLWNKSRSPLKCRNMSHVTSNLPSLTQSTSTHLKRISIALPCLKLLQSCPTCPHIPITSR